MSGLRGDQGDPAAGTPTAAGDDGLEPSRPLPAPTLEQKLEEALADVVSEEERTVVTRVVREIVQHEAYLGPIPHPEHLERYESILPGAADRLIAMAEKEQEHKNRWESRALIGELFYSTAGLALGFIVSISLIAGSIYCAITEHETVALALVGAAAIGLVPALIRGREMLKRVKHSPADVGPTVNSSADGSVPPRLGG